MDYLIKASAVLAIFYLVYIVWLQKETFFIGNRWYLLIGLIISALTPLVVIPIYINQVPQTLDLSQFTTVESTSKTSSLSWTTIASVIYFTGVVFFLIRFIIESLSLKTFLKSQNIKLKDGFNMSETIQDISPFSFFKTIVYNPNQFTDTELTHILNHEKVHARDYHSIDILISKLATIVFWCNPFIWLYKKALIQNLEFIADYKSIQQTHSTKTYQNVLLKTSVLTHQMPLTTNFYNSLIKKRILMLNTSKSKSIYTLKYVLIIPALVIFMINFNTKTIYAQSGSTASDAAPFKSTISILITKDHSDEMLESLENVLSSNNIDLKFKKIKRNSSNEIIAISITAKSDTEETNYKTDSNSTISPIKITYSDTEKSILIQVVAEDDSQVMFTSSKNASKVKANNKNSFIIPTSDGSSIVIKSSGAEFNDNDVMYISDDVKTTQKTTEKSKWDFQISEVEFSENLDSIKDEKTFNIPENSSVQLKSNLQEEPLILVDGKEISKTDMDNIDPNSIEQVNVIKDEKLTEKFGEKGKNGVVEISTKSSKSNSNPWKISPEVTELSTTGPQANVIYIIDGKESTQKEVDEINPDTIESINVIKDNNATAKYGDKAKDGIIEITLKKN
ncbi:peptidase, M56 family [Formosa agariphila KMM 3901]|uniref:Peptidase, M56 family n=1 Tax=Formosa agariphila (strain DSM 15362 / KCTC 12365 / LMG 23005 / KMM 3901 / M-2Alg 35-1) TaxID=1347342 RepID=T2KHS0_FORAG|nr:M56 family metallopeptidase [Formosa agariphila]CDF78397.1 peptidase, M56 family [Formosa agariphila KMM 3901]